MRAPMQGAIVGIDAIQEQTVERLVGGDVLALLFEEDFDVREVLTWAPGSRIVYSQPGDRNFHLLDPETETEEALLANDSVGWVGFPHTSPDGQRIAVFWNRTDRRGLRGTWVVSLEDSSRTLVYPGRADPVGWAANGQSVYVRERGSNDILLVPVSGGDGTVVATVPFEGSNYCVPVERPDGLDLLCNVVESVSDAWMIENFDPAVR